MPFWAWILLVAFAVFWGRGLACAAMWLKARRLKGLAWRFWRGELRYGDVGQREHEVVRLWQLARIEDAGVSEFERAPTGHVGVYRMSVFRNVFQQRGDVQQLVNDFFVRAEGYFKRETLRSLVPLYWPSVFLKLPEDVLVYFGLAADRSLVRVAQVVWPAAVAAAAGVRALIL